jgi:hypothetical protein
MENAFGKVLVHEFLRLTSSAKRVGFCGHDITLLEMEMVEQNCGTCLFFRPMTPEAGECRRMPPQVVVLQQSGTQPTMDQRTGVIAERPVIVQKPQGVFPALKTLDPGCGEYLMREPLEMAVGETSLTMHDEEDA